MADSYGLGLADMTCSRPRTVSVADLPCRVLITTSTHGRRACSGWQAWLMRATVQGHITRTARLAKYKIGDQSVLQLNFVASLAFTNCHEPPLSSHLCTLIFFDWDACTSGKDTRLVLRGVRFGRSWVTGSQPTSPSLDPAPKSASKWLLSLLRQRCPLILIPCPHPPSCADRSHCSESKCWCGSPECL